MIKGITAEEEKIINNILSQHKQDYDFYYYGSRVKGNYEKTSDLDILIKGNEEMPYDDTVTNNVIVTLTVILLMNQQRLNVSQDQSLNSSLMDIIESAYSARA